LAVLVLNMLTVPAVMVAVLGLVAVLTRPEGVAGVFLSLFEGCGLGCALALPVVTLGSAALVGRVLGVVLRRFACITDVPAAPAGPRGREPPMTRGVQDPSQMDSANHPKRQDD